jgi:uncharacterized membrane protein YhaH (DUF805 family)
MNHYLNCLKKYATFSGRASRSEFWYFNLFNFIFGIILGIFKLDVLDGLYNLIILLPSIAVACRRLHDIDKSGWFMLIPVYNIILFCQKSKLNSRFDLPITEEQGFAYKGSHLTIDDLTKLAEMKEKGYITEDEFAAKKKQILG